MGKWKLAPNTRMVWRDDDDVRHSHRGGEEVELTKEQEQRHGAGQPGSAFLPLDAKDPDEPETVEVAVANEATKPAEDGTPPVTPVGTRNRRVAAAPLPTAESEREDESKSESTESPTTTRTSSPTTTSTEGTRTTRSTTTSPRK